MQPYALYVIVEKGELKGKAYEGLLRKVFGYTVLNVPRVALHKIV